MELDRAGPKSHYRAGHGVVVMDHAPINGPLVSSTASSLQHLTFTHHDDPVHVPKALGVFFKNVERTIELCRQSDAPEIWLMTPTKGVSDYDGVDRVFSAIPVEKTAEVYRSCDVLVKLSTVEGMFGPPLEMFHCGGTAVVYNVTGYDEYIRDGYNALVSQMHDEESVVENINALIHDSQLRARLQEGALRTAQLWPDWPEASRVFEQAVLHLATGESEDPPLLAAKCRLYQRWYERHVNVQQLLEKREGQAVVDLQNDFSRAYQRLQHVEHCLRLARQEAADYRATLEAVQRSKSFRLMQKVRKLPGVQTVLRR